MTKPDFISFDPQLYRLKINSLSDTALQRKEVLKVRGAYSGGFGIAGGIALSPVTAGVTLVGAAAGARTWHVASQKLDIIQTEMKKRGLPLHDETSRDKAIPGIFSGLTGGMNMAVGVEGSAAGYLMGEAANKAPKSGEGLSRIVSKERLERVRTAPSRMSGPYKEKVEELKKLWTDGDFDSLRKRMSWEARGSRR